MHRKLFNQIVGPLNFLDNLGWEVGSRRIVANCSQCGKPTNKPLPLEFYDCVWLCMPLFQTISYIYIYVTWFPWSCCGVSCHMMEICWEIPRFHDVLSYKRPYRCSSIVRHLWWHWGTRTSWVSMTGDHMAAQDWENDQENRWNYDEPQVFQVQTRHEQHFPRFYRACRICRQVAVRVFS